MYNQITTIARSGESKMPIGILYNTGWALPRSSNWSGLKSSNMADN